MSRAGQYAAGIGGGVAAGAGIGSFGGPLGTAIGAGVGGLAGLLGTAFGTEDEDEQRKQQEALFAQQQQLQREQYRARQVQSVAARLGGDPAFSTATNRKLFDRGMDLDKQRFDLGMKQAEPNAYQQWVAPLLGAGAAVMGGLKRDPLAGKREQLNSTSDEADYIDSLGKIPNLATALEENDARTRSALFGPKTRMNKYEF
jgi:hypothetical protein